MNPTTFVVIALTSAAGGALFMPALVFIAIKLNLKGIRTVYAGIRQDARFYRAWAIVGGVLGASYSTAIAILQQARTFRDWSVFVHFARVNVSTGGDIKVVFGDLLAGDDAAKFLHLAPGLEGVGNAGYGVIGEVVLGVLLLSAAAN